MSLTALAEDWGPVPTTHMVDDNHLSQGDQHPLLVYTGF